jgi:hypothetical protein
MSTLREQLIGVWKLVYYIEKPVDGSKVVHPFGESPQGIILYTPMGSCLRNSLRPAVSRSPRATGSAAHQRITKQRLRTISLTRTVRR